MRLTPDLPFRRCLRLLALLLAFLPLAPAVADDDFLPVRAAYKVSTAVEAGNLVVSFTVAPGYYLYRDRLGFESATSGVTLGPPALPAGLDHEDEFFGKQVIYRDRVQVGVPVTFAGTAQDFELKLKLQGCADAGLCYPPQTWTVPVSWPVDRAAAPAVPAAGATAAKQGGGFNLRSLLGSGAKSDSDFLPVDQAFVLTASSPARDRLRLHWVIADDYYLYRDKVTVKTTSTDVQLGNPSIPGGETRHDEYFGEQVVFHGEMVADVGVSAAAGVTEVPIEVTYQGCADAGLCYPPTRKTLVVTLAAAGADATTADATATPQPMRSEQDLLADKIRDGVGERHAEHVRQRQ
jgi:thioredoxin:protein disulfide reductase